ncbi:hypothetical protein KI387_004840, partial [Taxus chinensis]
MEKRQNAPQMNLQMLKNLSRMDKFVDRTWKKSALYEKHSLRSLSRNQGCSRSVSDLEAETGFKMQHGIRNSTRSQAIRRVFDRRSRSPSKSGTPVSRLLRGRRTGKMNWKIASPLSSSHKFYYGSETGSSGPSSHLTCTEDINTSCNFPYHESCDKHKSLLMDSLHVFKSTDQENHKENHPLHVLKNQEYCELQGDLDQSMRESEENHLGLSQKYRPKSFKEFIGQKLVRKSLKNALLKRKVAPIYLFYGPRGTGKTSAARIFASALNCSSPNRKLKPCCKCRECLLFLSGKSPHVTELNAAGNDVIERLKICLETANFDYAASGYRVFIVEDCHELSPEAWSAAFQKCMENAIGYVVFILITVDLEWVPITALSRCQKFCFQKLRDVDIFNRLKKLAFAEKINIEDDALHLITARAEGSLRDAENALEQFSLSSSAITLSRVRQMIGLLPYGKLLDLLDFALSADTENTVRCTGEIIDSGVKPLALVSQLATLVMDILANNCLSAEAQETQDFIASMDKTEKLGRALKILSEAEKQLRDSNECISWLTAALLQFGPDELNPNPPSTIDTCITHTSMDLHNLSQREMDEMDPAYEEEKCHLNDRWNVHEVLHEVLSESNPHSQAIEAKGTGIADSVDTGCGFAENSTSTLCNLSKTEPGHPHDTKTNSFPVPSPLSNCAIEEGKLELNAMSPCKVNEIWQRMLKSSQSTTLEDLLQGQGKLVSLLTCKANTGAIAHVEFRHHHQNKNVERLQVAISNALQEALGCPVEVKMMITPSNCEPDNVEWGTN